MVDTVPLASRARYEEKQLLYYQELSNQLGSSIIASLVSEYNPVHLVAPFCIRDKKQKIADAFTNKDFSDKI
jgi:hypothetical protein